MPSRCRWFAVIAIVSATIVLLVPRAAFAGSAGLSVAQCLTSTDNEATGCTEVSGAAADLFDHDQSIAIAPDGKSLYLASNAGVSWYSLAADGDMTYEGCLDCASIATSYPSVRAASALAVAPDGSALYVGADDSLDRFSIGTDGTPTFTSCIDDGGDGGNCADGPNTGYASLSMLVSSDSSSVYVGDGFSKISVGAGGALTVAACLVASAETDCTTVPSNVSDALGVERLAFAPDGSIYGMGSGYLTHFATTGSLAIDSCATVTPESDDTGLAGCATQLTDAQVGEFVDGSIDVAPDGHHLLVSDDYELAKFDIGSGSSAPTFDSCYGLASVTPAACTALPQPIDGDFNHDALLQSGTTLYAGNEDGVDTLSVDSSLTPSTVGCLTYASSSTPPCDIANPPAAVVSGAVMVMSPTLPRIYVPADNGEDSGLTELTIAGGAVQPAPTTTRLAVAPSPATAGKSVTLTATVSSPGASPTGTVKFAVGSATLPGCAAQPIASTAPHLATCTHTFTAAAKVQFAAIYSGSADFKPSQATDTLTIDKQPTKTTLHVRRHHTSKVETLHLSATVKPKSGSAKPGGQVAFTRNGKPISGCSSRALHHGKARCSLAVSHGKLVIKARYLGTSEFAASKASQKVSVT